MPTKPKSARKNGPRSKKLNRYAKARVAAGLTYRDLLRKGFSSGVITQFEQGKPTSNKIIRAAYLAEIGLKG